MNTLNLLTTSCISCMYLNSPCLTCLQATIVKLNKRNLEETMLNYNALNSLNLSITPIRNDISTKRVKLNSSYRVNETLSSSSSSSNTTSSNDSPSPSSTTSSIDSPFSLLTDFPTVPSSTSTSIVSSPTTSTSSLIPLTPSLKLIEIQPSPLPFPFDEEENFLNLNSSPLLSSLPLPLLISIPTVVVVGTVKVCIYDRRIGHSFLTPKINLPPRISARVFAGRLRSTEY